MLTDEQQWDAQCKEYEIAHREDFQGFASVSAAFRRVASGTGGNPSDEDLTSWENARAKLDEIKQRMDDFIEVRFGKTC